MTTEELLLEIQMLREENEKLKKQLDTKLDLQELTFIGPI